MSKTRPTAPTQTSEMSTSIGPFTPFALWLIASWIGVFTKVEDAAAEFNSRVHIVSPPPTFFHLTFLI
jgi:hypothetical protein